MWYPFRYPEKIAMPKLTNGFVTSIRPRDKDIVVWDTEIPGFGIRVRPSGKRVYILKYRTKQGRQRKPTIGQHGPLKANKAREIARRWLVDVAEGGDPSADKQADRHAPTMADLCDRYLKEHAEPHKRPSSVANDRRVIEKRILRELGNHTLNAVGRADLARLHHSLRKTPYEANRTLALLSKMFNLAEAWGLRPDGTNPCRHVKKFKEVKRERFLSPDELAELNKVLAEAERSQTEMPGVLLAIRLLVLTGCRLSEILTLRWDWVDFEAGCLRLPESKTGSKVVQLGTPALALLSGNPRQPDNPFVIVGRKRGSHLLNLGKPWHRIRAKAKLNNVRIHDLRHTFASYGAAANLSLPMIGKMLGHTQAATTQRYAHLAADPVKQATDAVSRTIDAAMRGEAAEVVSFDKSRTNNGK